MKRNEKEKVMFYLPPSPYFTHNLKPLILRYTESEKECVLIFPKEEVLMGQGFVLMEKVMDMIEEFQEAGAKCFFADEKTLYDNEYSICFLCSEYSGCLPKELRKMSQCVVAVQATSLYTHMYQIKGRFEEVFSDWSRGEIDYLVVSEYIADWICKRDERWGEKILRFGYPKLDAIYYALKHQADIPKEWRDRICGKKVFLMTVNWPEQIWLDYFADRTDEMIVVWRPHPYLMTQEEDLERITEISERYNMIVDDMKSYETSFQISDAMIASLHSSVTMNYLYTGKPVCIYGREETYQNAVIDYRDELWYQCAHGTSYAEDVLNFIDKLLNGEVMLTEEQIMCRKRLTSQFDGEICNRIYEFFDNNKRETSGELMQEVLDA